MQQTSQHELIESAINKLSGLVPEPVGSERLKELIADRVPKAFYYQMLLDLLSKKDDREAEIILTEARFLVTLLLFKVERKSVLTPPTTKI